IHDTFPFQLKRLRQYLRQRKIGSVTIKKRGSPLNPDQLRQQLRLKGRHHALFFLSQHEGNPIVIIASPYKTV
ncbi:MAG TPA: SAM-dependent methyltransferase, partial [Anaerolineae bacterium]|nr:SAM-dependent methyltransferase [Anaerolineae bacterium]